MDDFLTRLADRQLQPGHGVRPVRPSRFEPAGAAEPWVEDAAEPPPLSSPPPMPRSGEHRGPSPDHAIVPAGVEGHLVRRPFGPAPTPPAPVPPGSVPLVSGHALPAGVIGDPAVRPLPGRGAHPRDTPADTRPAPPTPPAAPMTRPADQPVFAPLPRRPQPTDAVPPPAVAARPAAAGVGPALVRRGWRPEPIRIPDPLTPQAPAAVTSPIAAPPEVTVTIGRLEIRAPTAPTPAQAPAPQRPEPRLSLADYLADRDQGRR